MACGCKNKGAKRSATPPRVAPAQSQKNVQPKQATTPVRSVSGMSEERLKVERVRREAIRKSLNK